MKVFIYATLKSKNILDQALGEKHGKKLIPATLRDYEEEYVDKEWPTITQVHVGEVKGYVIEVSAEELNKLDNWEDHYQRIKVRLWQPGIYVYAYQYRGN